jgi:hypothetical protein
VEGLIFSYRGTDIMRITEVVSYIDAGEYEHTASTYAQRKSIKESVGEFIEYAEKTAQARKKAGSDNSTTKKASEVIVSQANENTEGEHRRSIEGAG